MNLPDLVKGYFDSETTLGLADAMGQPSKRVHAAIKSAVPLLLLGVASKARQPEGLQSVAQASDQRDPTVLDNFRDLVNARQLRSLTASGSYSLSNVLGQHNVDLIANTLQRAHQLPVASGRWLLSLMGSVIFALLRRHSDNSGPIGSASIAALLGANASDITQAIPPELHEHLAAEPYLHELAHATYDQGAAATASDDAMHDESELPRQEFVPALHGSPDRPNPATWVVPVLLLVAVLSGVLWVVWPRQNGGYSTAMKQPQPSPVAIPAGPDQNNLGEPSAQPAGSRIPAISGNQPANAVSAMTNPALHLLRSSEALSGVGTADESLHARQLASIFDQLSGTIGRIHDRASALDAVAPLQQVSRQLDQVSAMLGGGDASGDQASLRSALGRAAPNVRKAVDYLGAIPGVNSDIRPITDQIADKLDRLGK